MSKITKTQLMLFKSSDSDIELQGTLYQGKPVFFAVELAKAIGYKNPHEALQDNCKSLIKLNSSQALELNLGFYPIPERHYPCAGVRSLSPDIEKQAPLR